MFVVDRVRHEVNGTPEEVVEMAGTTGNLYTVTINHLPTCTCPDHLKGNMCKHIIYVRSSISPRSWSAVAEAS